MARGDAPATGDIDVLVELDELYPIGVFEYARLKIYINNLLLETADVVNQRALKPLLRECILRDAVQAF